MSAFDDEVEDEIKLTTAYIDTSAHFTAVSSDVVSPKFWNYLKKSESNAIYRQGEGGNVKVQLDMMLDIKGVAEYTFNIVAVVCDKLPNNFQGVLLGQNSFLDAMQFKLTPTRVSRVLNHAEEERKDAMDGWGSIEISCFVDAEDRLVSFNED